MHAYLEVCYDLEESATQLVHLPATAQIMEQDNRTQTLTQDDKMPVHVGLGLAPLSH